MSLVRTCVGVLCLMTASACRVSDPYVPFNDAEGIVAGRLNVTSTPAGISFANQSDTPIHYFAIEEGMLPLYDGVPCVECNPVKPGETVLMPWAQVIGNAPEKHSYRVWWWQVATAPDGSRQAVYGQGVTLTR